jgi:uncharacterized membrane protein YecN with MAPEG domain
MILPTTLCAAAAAALINIWLSIRCGMVRTSEKISIGDGGNEKLIARMRAHSVLVLIAALELARGGSTALSAVAAVFMLGRVAHGLGMDGGAFGGGRIAGTIITMLTLLGLGIWAVMTALA